MSEREVRRLRSLCLRFHFNRMFIGWFKRLKLHLVDVCIEGAEEADELS